MVSPATKTQTNDKNSRFRKKKLTDMNTQIIFYAMLF